MKENISIELIPDANGILDISDVIKNFRGMHYDVLYKQSFKFESGRAYGIISEYGQGCELPGYLLGGRLSDRSYSEFKILINGKEASAAALGALSWDAEPYKTRYQNLKVKKSIEGALKKGLVSDDLDSIAESFGLTEARYDRRLKQLSGERWFASMAIGYALGKRIFYAPYQTSSFYRQCSVRFKMAIAKLKAENCIILLPCGSDRVLSDLVDDCIFVDGIDPLHN